MGIGTPSFEFMSMYIISIIVVSALSILIIEWFDKRFEKLIVPTCDKISNRRKKVLEKEQADRVK